MHFPLHEDHISGITSNQIAASTKLVALDFAGGGFWQQSNELNPARYLRRHR